MNLYLAEAEIIIEDWATNIWKLVHHYRASIRNKQSLSVMSSRQSEKLRFEIRGLLLMRLFSFFSVYNKKSDMFHGIFFKWMELTHSVIDFPTFSKSNWQMAEYGIANLRKIMKHQKDSTNSRTRLIPSIILSFGVV
jgi:hypothetical protein